MEYFFVVQKDKSSDVEDQQPRKAWSGCVAENRVLRMLLVVFISFGFFFGKY